MLYDYQYDIVSIIAILFLLINYFIRRNYKTKSNFIFLILILIDLVGSVFDFISCYTISYPDRYPSWVNYVVSMIYYIAYNCMGILFFYYIDSKSKISIMKELTEKIVFISITVISILVISSPYTHFIFYYDENNKYVHGPLLILLYMIAVTFLLGGIVMFCFAKRRFNRYQRFAIISFVAMVLAGLLISVIMPRVLVGQLSCTLVLIFFYIALENPVYYTYKDTNCYNRNAFLGTIKRYTRSKERVGKIISVVGVGIKDYGFIKHDLSLNNLERLSSNIAEFVHNTFDSNGYCIADDKFVIILDHYIDYDYVVEHFEEFCSKPIKLLRNEIGIDVNYVHIENIDLDIDVDSIENGINSILEKTKTDKTYIDDFSKVVSAVNRVPAISHVLQNAIKNDLFDVYYQPIYGVAERKFVNVEALLRIKDKSIGYIGPDEFIPIAERDGKICEMGEIVFKKVCKFIKESESIKKGVKCFEINLSPVQCAQEGLAERFEKIMEEYEISPSYINLEITETAELENNPVMINNIVKLSRLGISFSLDDYGSGFAATDYLYRLPVSVVKIDKSILWQAIKNKNAMIVLRNTVEMVKKLGKKIVVEGVENKEMVAILTEMGCDFMQGFYFSKPVSGRDYIKFLEDNSL